MTEPHGHQNVPPRSITDDGTAHSTSTGHGISIKLPTGAHDSAPQPARHWSAPSYHSPTRHHRRAPSRSTPVKETLNARSHYGSSDDDGAAVHRINQYAIKQEIGRGSFGAVHLAVDQYGHEFAIKEFSKSRLRKRAQSNLLRKPNQGRRPGQLAAGLGFNSPLHRVLSSDVMGPEAANNSLNLIKEEIAIMKKLSHNNLVSLLEVLDDPDEDSLYMVLEMCKKGVAMKVGVDERAVPYDDETCRCWFRDMILGIEYLHEQGIIHRDIKPDNCLITDDDVLKIVDFGVSEMFEKASDMATAKSAGSPAFMPPELCVAKHGQVSGRAADIWSMGVTLFCLRYGHIPFERSNMLELYGSIRDDDPPLNQEKDPNFADLIQRLLDKNPETRITMDELRTHPWVTKNGSDELLSARENCADLIEPPTEQEMNHAITGNMGNVLVVLKAAKRFKTLIGRKHADFMGFFGRESTLVAPPPPIETQKESHDERPGTRVPGTGDEDHESEADSKLSGKMNSMALHQDREGDSVPHARPTLGASNAHFKQRAETFDHIPPSPADTAAHRTRMSARSRSLPFDEYAKGHAHDPLEDTLFLHIGPDPETPEPDSTAEDPIVSESPPAVDVNIYEQAYQDEMDRILRKRGQEPSMFMNRRIEHRDDIRLHSAIRDASRLAAKYAVETASMLHTRGMAAGAGLEEAGRSAARSAFDKFNTSLDDVRTNLDASKLAAASTAAEGLQTGRAAAQGAATRFGVKSDTGAMAKSKIADLVSRAQERSHAGTTSNKEDTTAANPSADQRASPEPIDDPRDTKLGIPGGYPASPRPQ